MQTLAWLIRGKPLHVFQRMWRSTRLPWAMIDRSWIQMLGSALHSSFVVHFQQRRVVGSEDGHSLGKATASGLQICLCPRWTSHQLNALILHFRFYMALILIRQSLIFAPLASHTCSIQTFLVQNRCRWPGLSSRILQAEFRTTRLIVATRSLVPQASNEADSSLPVYYLDSAIKLTSTITLAALSCPVTTTINIDKQSA